jgi:hypothetical protein
MQLKDIKGYVEYNSSYISGELSNKFQAFIRNYDSLGLKIEGLKIDNSFDGKEFEENDILLDVTNDLKNEEFPQVWVMIDDNELHPVFKSINTDINMIDLDKALQDYGLDIIMLVTETSEIVKTVKFNICGEELEFRGTLKEIQKTVIDYFDYDSVKEKIFKELQDCFYSNKEMVGSFVVEIPKHLEHIVLKISA